MAKNGVIEKVECASMNIDALNRSVVSTTDIQNGTPLTLTWSAEDGDDVFKATKAGAGAKDVWLAFGDEVNKLEVGKVFGGLDPEYFINVAGRPYDAFKPTPSSIIKFSKACFVTNLDPDTVANATVVELTANGFEAKATATANYTGIAFKIGRKQAIVKATGTPLISELQDAWLLECTNN